MLALEPCHGKYINFRLWQIPQSRLLQKYLSKLLSKKWKFPEIKKKKFQRNNEVIIEIIIEALQITEEWNEENLERKWLSNRETTPFQRIIYVALNEKRNYDFGCRSGAGLEADSYLLFT